MSRLKFFRWRIEGWFAQRRDPVNVDELLIDLGASSVQRSRSYRKRTPARPGCPTPTKRVFASEAAAKSARHSRRHKGQGMRTYLCPCGGWHLSVKRRRSS